MSKVIRVCFGFALLSALWLVKKTRATFATNGNPNQNQSCFRRTRFPALGASYMYLLRILIGLSCCLHLLRLARLITLVWFYDTQLEIGNRSKASNTPGDFFRRSRRCSSFENSCDKIAQPDGLALLAIHSNKRRKSRERAHLANAADIWHVRYRRKSQSLHRARLAIFADRGDRRTKSPSVSLA